MNKGSLVRWVGHDYRGNKHSGFTRKKVYKVLAGQGDGVPRNDGKLGAYIQNEHQFVVEDDCRSLRLQTIKSSDWELVKEAESTYVPKPDYKSPVIPGRVATASEFESLVIGGEVAQGDFYGHG